MAGAVLHMQMGGFGSLNLGAPYGRSARLADLPADAADCSLAMPAARIVTSESASQRGRCAALVQPTKYGPFSLVLLARRATHATPSVLPRPGVAWKGRGSAVVGVGGRL
jgi:hypothetical protein